MYTYKSSTDTIPEINEYCLNSFKKAGLKWGEIDPALF